MTRTYVRTSLTPTGAALTCIDALIVVSVWALVTKGRVSQIAFKVLAIFELGGAVFILNSDRSAGRQAVMLAISRCAVREALR